jgi:adenylate cyclase
MKRLRYISSFAQPMDREAIQSLALQAQQHNERAGVTGILVATGDLFFQIIEGPDDEIDRVFERINKDPRHSRVLVLSVEQGDFSRLCPDWAMRKVDLSRDTAERAAPIRAMLHIAYAQRQLLDEAVTALEAFTWRGFIDAEVEALSAESDGPAAH